MVFRGRDFHNRGPLTRRFRSTRRHRVPRDVLIGWVPLEYVNLDYAYVLFVR